VLLHICEFGFANLHPKSFRHAAAISRIGFGKVLNLELGDALRDAPHVTCHVTNERSSFRLGHKPE